MCTSHPVYTIDMYNYSLAKVSVPPFQESGGEVKKLSVHVAA